MSAMQIKAKEELMQQVAVLPVKMSIEAELEGFGRRIHYVSWLISVKLCANQIHYEITNGIHT